MERATSTWVNVEPAANLHKTQQIHRILHYHRPTEYKVSKYKVSKATFTKNSISDVCRGRKSGFGCFQQKKRNNFQ